MSQPGRKKKKKKMTSPTDLKSMTILVRVLTRFVISLREVEGSVKISEAGGSGAVTACACAVGAACVAVQGAGCVLLVPFPLLLL